MRYPVVLLGAALLAMLVAAPAARAATKPVPVIFDTDIGPDVDDAGAVAVLHALADAGEARILAMGACVSSEWAAPCLDALNTYYGRPDIPIGTFKGAGFLVDSKYNGQIARDFPNDLRNGRNAPDAASLYRRILSRQPDRSVVMCAVGPVNNLRRLLESGPDEFSRLRGTELVARKVRLLSVMGGRYPEGKEWNFEQDPAAAAVVMQNWPTPVLLSGFEIGARVHTGQPLHSRTGADNPVRAAYALYVGPEKDRESWDLTAVLAAVRGPASHWTESVTGSATVDAKSGANSWLTSAAGRHTYLIERDPPARVKEVLDELMVRPPRRTAARR